MKDFDWKGVVQTVAPTIATALGGPLAGTAVRLLGEAVLGDSGASQDAVQIALSQGVTPDQIQKMKDAENAFSVRMTELGLQEKDLLFKQEQAYLQDTQDARRANAANKDVFTLGIVILSSFTLIVLGALVGSGLILTGGLVVTDAATVGMVSGFIGTLVGYVAANAQQVVSFYFGSSKGSDRKTDALADAFKNHNRK
jgi:hypothetical protein